MKAQAQVDSQAPMSSVSVMNLAFLVAVLTMSSLCAIAGNSIVLTGSVQASIQNGDEVIVELVQNDVVQALQVDEDGRFRLKALRGENALLRISLNGEVLNTVKLNLSDPSTKRGKLKFNLLLSEDDTEPMIAEYSAVHSHASANMRLP